MTEPVNHTEPTRVAIIGGGCAAMTTAWELTQPHLRGAFEVTDEFVGYRLPQRIVIAQLHHRNRQTR